MSRVGSFLPQATEAQIASYCSGGRLNWLTSSDCWAKSLAEWQRIGGPIAGPPAPTGAVLILAPANQETAARQVEDLANAQLQAQQGRNGDRIETRAAWQAASAAVAAAIAADEALNAAVDAVTPSAKTLWLIGGGLALLLLLIARNGRR